MSDTVIAPRYQMRYEQLVNTPVLDRIPYFHDREIEYILEVSKAEQDNVALRAIVPYLQHVPEDIIAVWAKDGKCGECGKQINFSSAYRCYDCGTIHHKECLKTHIKESDPRSYMCARKMDQELVALRAKVAKLEAPVSDEEWRDCSTFYDGTDHDYDTEAMERGSVDALIAARGREGE